MERKIEFRGKSVETDKWVYGFFCETTNGVTCIVENDCFVAVKPETVGQFTGFISSDGQSIFEHDIVYADTLPWGGYEKVRTGIYQVKFALFRWYLEDIAPLETSVGDLDIVHDRKIILVGNIFDNPERMKKD